jgi:signal transduction histidine kinase
VGIMGWQNGINAFEDSIIYSNVTDESNNEEMQKSKGEASRHVLNEIGNTRLKLHESIVKYKYLFNSIDEGFCIIEMIFDSLGEPVNYRFIEVNPAFEKQTELKDAVGKLMLDLAPNHEKHWFEIYGKVALTGEPVRFINEAKALNRWYTVNAFKMGTMETRYVAVLFNDITEEVKAKRKLEEIMEMQEAFFANVSHELKTPLNLVYSATQLMEMYLENNMLENNKEKLSNNIDIIRQNCFRLTRLINNIVDLSKIESGFFNLNLSNENIVYITEDIVQSISEYIKLKGINITFDTNVEEKVIACDPDKIERVLLNLISNAIKFTNQNGSIFVDIYDKDDTVEIAVKDTGIGIDEKHLTKIFERFQQVDKSLSRNAEGTGIGLSIVKGIVEMHGGKIIVESSLGEGSIFRVQLPTKTIENSRIDSQSSPINCKIEMIKVEFSDIYSMV